MSISNGMSINRTKGGASAPIYIYSKYPRNISAFYLIWLSRTARAEQRGSSIEFIINFLRTAILSRRIPVAAGPPALFRIGTPFLSPVNRKSCANDCSAISARGRNQMNAWWMPGGRPMAGAAGAWGDVLKDRRRRRDKNPPRACSAHPSNNFTGYFTIFFSDLLRW